MQISVQWTLEPTDTPPTMTSDEAAEVVLLALGGDLTTDFCTVMIHRPGGSAGIPPATPTPPPDTPPLIS